MIRLCKSGQELFSQSLIFSECTLFEMPETIQKFYFNCFDISICLVEPLIFAKNTFSFVNYNGFDLFKYTSRGHFLSRDTVVKMADMSKKVQDF